MAWKNEDEVTVTTRKLFHRNTEVIANSNRRRSQSRMPVYGTVEFYVEGLLAKNPESCGVGRLPRESI